jgi:hypothetical protein
LGELIGRVVLEGAPRLLGLGDRDLASPTAGSFDRAYWHYRMTDYPNGRFQEAALGVASLYVWQDARNRYGGKDAMRQWAGAAIQRWCDQRNRNGSVNEAYPFDQSYCATAFSFLAALSTMRLIRPGETEYDLVRAARWLSRHRKPDVANQEAAAALALAMAAETTGDSRWQNAAQQRAEGVAAGQMPNGGYCEYGGVDTGYHTVTMGLLHRLYELTGWEWLDASLERARDYIDSAVGPGGQFDTNSTSRRTGFLYLEGIVARNCRCLPLIVDGLSDNAVLNPLWMDDRYFVPFFNDYVSVLLRLQGQDDGEEGASPQ